MANLWHPVGKAKKSPERKQELSDIIGDHKGKRIEKKRRR